MSLVRYLATSTVAALFTIAGVAGCSSSNTGPETAGGPPPAPARLAAENSGPAGWRYSLVYPNGKRNDGVVLLEADVPDQVRVGQSFNYTMRITNLTDYPVQQVRVYDVGEQTGTALSARGTTRPAHEEPMTWEVGYLGPHQSETRQFSGVADEVGSIHNCLAVSYAPTLCTAINVVKPELEITKTTPERAMICQEIDWAYSVTNTGSGAAQNVRITDNLPDGLTTVDGAKQVSFDVASLQPGQTSQFVAKLKAQRTGDFASRAVVHSGDTEASSRDVHTIVAAPALAVDVTGPESRYANEPIDYRVTVRNTGDAPSQNTSVHLTFSTGESIPDHNLGTIDPGQSKDFEITLRSAAGGNITLQAAAIGTCVQQPATGEATVQITTVPAMRLGVVHSVDPVRVGHNTVYTISVANTGTGPDKHAVVTATLPPEEEFVSGNGTTQVTANGQEITFGPIDTMAPGQTATWNVEVKASKAGDVAFRATLRSDSTSQKAEKIEPTRIVP